MKNILGTTENLEFYNKDGGLVYEFCKDSNELYYEFTFDKDGNTLIYKDSNGLHTEDTYDKNGNELTHKNSYGYFHKYTRDENGKELTFKDSHGIERGFESKIK